MPPTPPAFELELTRVIEAPRAPDGTTHAFSGTDRALVPPSTLTWTGACATGPADQRTTVITREERGRQTQVHARQTFHGMTPEIAQATQGAQQGWTMTLDQLAACCAAP